VNIGGLGLGGVFLEFHRYFQVYPITPLSLQWENSGTIKLTGTKSRWSTPSMSNLWIEKHAMIRPCSEIIVGNKNPQKRDLIALASRAFRQG